MNKKNKKIYPAPSQPLQPKPKRNININFRLTLSEKEDWESKAESMGCGTLSKFIRSSVENNCIRIVAPPPSINKDFYIELGRIGNNLNQITKAINYSVKVGNHIDVDTRPEIEELKLLLQKVQGLIIGMPQDTAPNSEDE